MTKDNMESLLEVTKYQISYYKDFMSGEGNHDEFDFALFSDHVEGYFEDYLMFGNKVLQILVRRKHKLEYELSKIEEEN